MIEHLSRRFQKAAFAAGLAVALAIFPSIVSAADPGLVDTAFNAWDKLYDYVNQSRKGVIEAMDQGGQRDGGAPFTQEYSEGLLKKNQNLYNRNKDLLPEQEKLVKAGRELLDQLPKDDPRRAKVLEKTKTVIVQASDTRGNIKTYGDAVATSTIDVLTWKKKKDVLYQPSDAEKAALKLAKKEEAKTTEPEPPPKGADDLAKLKNLEKNLEKLARELGKVREAAVKKYLEDPSPYNKRQAEQIKEELVKLVEKLNDVRGEVDEKEGTDRPDLTIKTAREIARQVARQAAGDAASVARTTGREGHHQGGMGHPKPPKPPLPEGHHHGAGGGD
jgi:hypothetical protein